MFGSMRGAPDQADPRESRMMVVENRDGPGGTPETTIPPALTDGQGHYELRGLPHATYTVVAEAQHGQLRARATDVKPDATVDLRALGVTALSGTVTGPAGPAALFSIELDGPTRAQRSFTDGKFSFGRVDPGAYAVRVQASDGHGEARVTVTPNEPATLDVTLSANAVVIGRLVDGTGGPLAGELITLVPDSGDGRLQIQIDGSPSASAPDGRFRIEHGAGSSVLVVIRSPQPFTKRGLVLEAGKTLDLGTIKIDAQNTGPGSSPRP
jgi:hypothetical protein